MRFGIGPYLGQRPTGERSVTEVHETLLEMSERAEAAGFDAVFTSEHHFTDIDHTPAPLTLASAIAGRTDGLEVGSAIAQAPFYEPLRLAETTAVADAVASVGGGTFTLGLGTGYLDFEFEGYGVPKAERIPRLLDAVATCRGAWSEGPLDVDGRTVDYGAVEVTPKPPNDVPILIGALADSAIERAARIADGYLVPPDMDLGEIEETCGLIADVLAANDRDPAEFDIYVLKHGYLHEDGADAAWDVFEEPYFSVRRNYTQWMARAGEIDSEVADLLDTDGTETAEELAQLRDQWREAPICGDAGTWVEALEPLADVWPHEVTAIPHLVYPGMSRAEMTRTVDRFGEAVIPALSDA
jgi:alkanesulfonate monooxygenase SsuD/methylene tetrahydromethanopterin reductase-like flavin-dependent oxidoreductase (luciferase family)